MEAQMHRDPHDIEVKGEEHDQHHGEKKSVLKKVKDKAKKIKNTITKHGHEHEHEHDPVRTAEEYEEDEDEEMAKDPEIHGAPVYESTVIRSTNLPMQTDLNLENPSDRREDRYDGSKMASPATEEYDPERKAPLQPGPDAMGVEEPVFKIGPVLGLQEASKHETDPSNYQTKVTDPTREGGKEADVAPLVRRFDNLNVHDESESKTATERESYTGSHDQFAPVPAVNEDQPGHESIVSGLKTKSADPSRHETIPGDTNAGKTSSVTAVLADTAVSAKNIVASKLGYGGGEHPESHDSAASGKPISESAAEYGRKVVQTLAPVYGKVVETGSTLVSKVGGGGGSQHAGGETAADKGVTVKEYLAEKLRPGDEDKALSEAITEAFQKKKEPPLGRVTESPEVAARLGTGKEGKREGVDALSAGIESSGGGMAERLRDAVGSWLGKSTGMETAQQSLGQSHVVLSRKMLVELGWARKRATDRSGGGARNLATKCGGAGIHGLCQRIQDHPRLEHEY